MAAKAPSQRTGVIARKMGMMRIFADDGAHVPVTVLKLDNVQVVGRRTVDAEEFVDAAGAKVDLKPNKQRKNAKSETARAPKGDGYVALQLGAGEGKARRAAKAERGQFAKAKVSLKAVVREFRVSPDNLAPIGAEITADHFVV